MTTEENPTPDILLPALRQYQHNDCSGLLAGFDYDETVKIVESLKEHYRKACFAAINQLPVSVYVDEVEEALKEVFE